MEPQISLVILAGGLGSRFGGAKQIARLPGIDSTIMELSIADAYDAGVRHLIIIINAMVRDAIEQQILPNLPADLDVDLVEQRISDVPSEFAALAQQRSKPWGTGHALLCAKSVIRDKAIVITADDYYGDIAFQQITEHFRRSENWGCVAYPLLNTLSEQGGVNRGICALNHAKQLLRVDEILDIQFEGNTLVGTNAQQTRVELDEHALASMTFWGIDLRLFTILEQNFYQFLSIHDNGVKKEYYLPDQIQYSIDTLGIAVDVYPAQQPWLGMTYKDELPVLAQKISALKGLTDVQHVIEE
ncbi:NTP transferase domain-containing protein [Pseudoalteromonas pernae]|uniref:NTP transferase domain-containing protein n=1 Tax=Pseudoalteromonas pernae TaxID=3118054 RepID=UPI0032421A16